MKQVECPFCGSVFSLAKVERNGGACPECDSLLPTMALDVDDDEDEFDDFDDDDAFDDDLDLDDDDAFDDDLDLDDDDAFDDDLDDEEF